MKTTALLVSALIAALALRAQERPPGAGVVDTPQRQAQALDRDGKGAEARVIWQRLIDNAADPAARAAAQRRMAMSWGFDGNCADAVKYEEMVIAYWVTREKEEPQNAFYQQGEMANEAARVCIDAGDLATAEKWYRKGAELGNKEPEPRTHPRSLWDYRTAHALARLNARRGNKAEALRQVTLARKVLDSDTAMAGPQERYYPYLMGYVALYTNDLKTAEAELTRGLAIRANQSDPFQNYLLALTYEKMGQTAKAMELYQKAYDLSTAHNPPAAFTRPAARKKLERSTP
jgi:tetratricopeptide (TPR) repeat protein